MFGTFGLIGVLVLIALLVHREMLVPLQGARVIRLQRALNIAIVPLLVVFVLLVATKVSEIIH